MWGRVTLRQAKDGASVLRPDSVSQLLNEKRICVIIDPMGRQ